MLLVLLLIKSGFSSKALSFEFGTVNFALLIEQFVSTAVAGSGFGPSFALAADSTMRNLNYAYFILYSILYIKNFIKPKLKFQTFQIDFS